MQMQKLMSEIHVSFQSIWAHNRPELQRAYLKLGTWRARILTLIFIQVLERQIMFKYET